MKRRRISRPRLNYSSNLFSDFADYTRDYARRIVENDEDFELNIYGDIYRMSNEDFPPHDYEASSVFQCGCIDCQIKQVKINRQGMAPATPPIIRERSENMAEGYNGPSDWDLERKERRNRL